MVCDAGAAEVQFDQLTAVDDASPDHRVPHLSASKPQHLHNDSMIPVSISLQLTVLAPSETCFSKDESGEPSRHKQAASLTSMSAAYSG